MLVDAHTFRRNFRCPYRHRDTVFKLCSLQTSHKEALNDSFVTFHSPRMAHSSKCTKHIFTFFHFSLFSHLLLNQLQIFQHFHLSFVHEITFMRSLYYLAYTLKTPSKSPVTICHRANLIHLPYKSLQGQPLLRCKSHLILLNKI